MAVESLVIVHNSDSESEVELSSADVFVLILPCEPQMAQRFASLNYAAGSEFNRHSRSVMPSALSTRVSS